MDFVEMVLINLDLSRINAVVKDATNKKFLAEQVAEKIDMDSIAEQVAGKFYDSLLDKLADRIEGKLVEKILDGLDEDEIMDGLACSD